MKTLKLTGLLICSLVFVRCTTTSSIISDYDREADFSQYKPFIGQMNFKWKMGVKEKLNLFFTIR